MNWHRIHRLGLIVGIITLVASACGSSGGGTVAGDTWGTATTAAGGGGMDALIAEANKEGKLNVIALPPNWCNYGPAPSGATATDFMISAFTAKYPGTGVDSPTPTAAASRRSTRSTSWQARIARP